MFRLFERRLPPTSVPDDSVPPEGFAAFPRRQFVIGMAVFAGTALPIYCKSNICAR
jgi:hypothetical protein